MANYKGKFTDIGQSAIPWKEREEAVGGGCGSTWVGGKNRGVRDTMANFLFVLQIKNTSHYPLNYIV